MRYITVLLIIFLFQLHGCSFAVDPSSALLSDTKKEAIIELARAGDEYFGLRNIYEDHDSIEIELDLRFNPISFTEVMALTDPLAHEVARLFDYKVPVIVGAIYTIAGSNEERIFSESLFSPVTGKTEYRLFGRDYVLQYGDP